MSMDYRNFAPYFRNGMLFLPQRTVSALLDAGLSRPLAEHALLGIPLDDRINLDNLSKAVFNLIIDMDPQHPLVGALANEETYFALTGVQQPA